MCKRGMVGMLHVAQVGEILEKPRTAEIEASGQFSATLPEGPAGPVMLSQEQRAAGIDAMLFK